MATYTTEQKRNIQTLLRVARQQGASPRETKALLEAAGVESGYRNLSYGDRDSTGILQQRTSQGWPGGGVTQQAVAFLSAAAKANTGGGSAGRLAQAVQRSAFPARYDQRAGEVEGLIGGQPSRSSRTSGSTTTTTTTPGVDNSGLRRQLVASFLQQGGIKNSGAVTQLAAGYRGAQDTPATTRTVTRGTRVASASPEADDQLGRILSEANHIDAAKVPYQWGGGHGGKQIRGSKVVPLDCSGAVSRILGVNPRVASQFEGWGQAGKGKNVTVYANGEHVLMEIGGHFWGTSRSNPGGGAGWIKKSDIPAGYLKRFTARHPPGL